MVFFQHIRAVLVLGLPLVGSHLAQISVQLVDTIMLGWYGIEPLAAGVLASFAAFVIFITGSGFAFAVMPLVAEAAENGNTQRIRQVTRMGIWLSLLYAAACLPLMIWSAPILISFGQKPQLAALAQDYLRIFGLGFFPSLTIMVLKSYLSALERTAIVLWVTLGGAVLNAVLNHMFIFGNWGMPEMGLRGSALASLLVQIVSCTVLCFYTMRNPLTAPHCLFQRIWKIDVPAFTTVFRLGWPIGLTNLAESGMFSASALIVGLLGTVPLAAHGIALQISSITFMVHVGFSSAATVRAGQAFARQDWSRLILGAKAVVSLALLVVLICTIAFLTIPELLMRGYLSPDDPDLPDILRIGTGLLAVAALFQLVDAGQIMALGLLRGIQDTKVPMYFSAFSYWIMGIPASYLLGITFGLGGLGVWLGLVVGLVVASSLLWWRFFNRLGRLRLDAAGVAGA